MIKLFIEKFNSFDDTIKKIVKYGFKFSFAVCILSILILLIGLSVFRLSLFFAVEFIICAIAIDTIKKQIC